MAALALLNVPEGLHLIEVDGRKVALSEHAYSVFMKLTQHSRGWLTARQAIEALDEKGLIDQDQLVLPIF